MFWNQSAQFAGNSSSYLAVPNSATINITGSFSIEAWINPASSGLKGVIAKGGTLGTSLEYAIRFDNNRVRLITNGGTKVISRASNTIPLNQWTHIAGTYNSTANLFRIYINGVLDTSSIVAGAAPPSNTDSLFIGISGAFTPFEGQIDEVRLWNRDLTPTEVNQYFRSTLSANTGIYSGLVMSLSFQSNQSQISFLSLVDKTENDNDAFNRGVTAVNLSDRPSLTILPNESVELDGTDDYISSPDDAKLSPTSAMTLEAWVYMRNTNPATFLSKGTNYRLGYNGAQITFGINNNFFSTGVSLGAGSWNHLALTYSGASGIYFFYLNGVLRNTDTLGTGNVINGTDSLLIGGGPLFGDLNGYIDEVRISTSVKSQSLINKFLYQSIESSNHPFAAAVYSLDGIVNSGSTGVPRLSFRNNARFSHPGRIAQPVSPLNRNDNSDFSESYYMKTSNKKIPSSGTAGSVSDSTNVNFNAAITDVNLFVALNHKNSSNIEIVLIAPNNDSVKVFDNETTLSTDNNLITVFNDQADSSLLSNRYATFSTVIRPENNMNAIFGGDNSQGRWKLIVRDEQSNDTGFLYSWGIQINNITQRTKDLDLSTLIQGFYNSLTNQMVPDTLTVQIRNGVSPYAGVDSSKVVLSSTGLGLCSFTGNASNNVQYYLRISHRNSIETWSNLFSFVNDEAVYSFLSSAATAFGNNQIQVDNSPVRFANYNGDVDHDGFVDGSDGLLIDNDASNFLSGYLVTDTNGDNFIDGSDAAVADNNAFNFVEKIVP